MNSLILLFPLSYLQIWSGGCDSGGGVGRPPEGRRFDSRVFSCPRARRLTLKLPLAALPTHEAVNSSAVWVLRQLTLRCTAREILFSVSSVDQRGSTFEDADFLTDAHGFSLCLLACLVSSRKDHQRWHYKIASESKDPLLQKWPNGDSATVTNVCCAGNRNMTEMWRV